MPCIIHKTGNRIISYHALNSAVTSCYNMQSCLRLRAGRTALAGGALLKLPSLGKPEDIPHLNGGLTCPKGPSHSAVGQGVNCPPLGPPGRWSSPEGNNWLLSVAVLCTQCTAELILRSSGVHHVQKFGCADCKLWNHTGWLHSKPRLAKYIFLKIAYKILGCYVQLYSAWCMMHDIFQV